MALTVIAGPPGSGKSGHVRSLLAAGEVDVIADTTALWAALGNYERDPETGRYPTRQDDDVALRLALYLQATAATFAAREGLNIAITTARKDQQSRWRTIAEDNGASFSYSEIDPGRAVVEQRLAQGGRLETACEVAIAKYYGLA